MRPRLSARARLQDDKISGQPVLIFPEGLVKLNPTAAEIVKLCNGARTVNQIADELAAQYNAPRERIAANVWEYLAKLREKNLVSW
ncbi:MAG TPA: pyrroloquinoline quinone biosynthesis peptide chaperone PqqD [Planctomycetota bacterium]|nr:pyrroloquinoline quinone biosynthesis peptide chaperone PqqD [Planctomycetota bacterium]